MKTLMVVALVCTAAASFAAAPTVTFAPGKPAVKKVRVNHVPETAKGLQPISDLAKKYRHIELVNVNNAVPAADWDVITRYVAEAMPMNFYTNTLDKSITMDLITGKIQQHEKVLGEKAKVAVFIEKDGSGRPSFLASAGRWSSVDITKAVSSAPDAQTVKDRIAKYLMRGIAYAIGGGASMEGNSTLSGRVVSLEQLDQTPIVCPPMSLFPLVEAVDALTNHEGGSRPMPEEEEEPTDAAKN